LSCPVVIVFFIIGSGSTRQQKISSSVDGSMAHAAANAAIGNDRNQSVAALHLVPS
jgi:hypothetical protein